MTPFTLARTERLLLERRVSGGDGRIARSAYCIDVAIPEGPAPPAGWPSVYLLDASDCFGTCVEALRRMSRRPNATGVSPAVVVGISWPDGDAALARRQYDFTTARHGMASKEAGGAHAFLAFLQEGVKPLVAERLPLDEGRQTLFGHSLAGYFALWVLTHRPRAFRSYAAISPSIWWDRNGLLDAAFRVALGDRRVLIALGEWEDELPPWQATSSDRAEVIARRKARAMVANARELSMRLQAALGEDGVRWLLLPEEDHASIVSVAIPRMLRLASLP
ncbi:alpha/beta hydrolase [Pendulispora albinea]|uniref:Esterase n=1 Tax=Pendulispora albinea TaxID=2741071 RepID=A0ABZ2LMA1_9BACT